MEGKGLEWNRRQPRDRRKGTQEASGRGGGLRNRRSSRRWLQEEVDSRGGSLRVKEKDSAAAGGTSLMRKEKNSAGCPRRRMWERGFRKRKMDQEEKEKQQQQQQQ